MKFDDVRVGDVFFSGIWGQPFVVTNKGKHFLHCVCNDGTIGRVYASDLVVFSEDIIFLKHHDRIILKGESDD